MTQDERTDVDSARLTAMAQTSIIDAGGGGSDHADAHSDRDQLVQFGSDLGVRTSSHPADLPDRDDLDFVGSPDPIINTLGCRGVGEIGITGVAAVLANAAYHATGKRVRDLPITLDKLL